MTTVKTQQIFADDIDAGDSFISEGTAWTATVDAYQDETTSYVYIPVVRLTFGGMEIPTTIRMRGDDPVTVIKF